MARRIEIINSSRGRVPQKVLRKLDSWLRRRLSIRKSVVCVFVGLAEGRRLNLQFRGRAYATDVLSFAPVEDASLGELVFCYDVIRKQAVDHQLSFRDELAYMYIHGVLHLLGHDHEKSSSAAKKMFALQDDLFDRWLIFLASKADTFYK